MKNHDAIATQKMYNAKTCQRNTQRGSVLAITLMLLVILALAGTFAIRNSTQSERVMNGVRTSNVSEHAAETALRFCEQLAQADDQSGRFGGLASSDYIYPANPADTPIASANDANAIWNKKANWASANVRVLKLPVAYYQTAQADATDLNHAPQCIIERLDTGNDTTGFIITARGFGNDAVIDGASGEVTSGAETWLQSTLTQQTP